MPVRTRNESRPNESDFETSAPERDLAPSVDRQVGSEARTKICGAGCGKREFLEGLAARAPDYSRGKRIACADLIFFSAKTLKDLANLKSLARSINRNGAIWVVYPKGQTHIREIDVITAGKSAGLTDNKVCSFSETHTALRFCIPVAKR